MPQAKGHSAHLATKLTRTQVKILSRCARGYTYVEIGKATKMTKDGVDWHVRQILRKLKAANTTNAVFKAVKRKIIR